MNLLLGRWPLSLKETIEDDWYSIFDTIDTVPNGGELDGAYGVLAGLECVRALIESDSFSPKRPIEVITFADEEGRFLDLLGFRAMAGELSITELEESTHNAGVRLDQVLSKQNLRLDTVLGSARKAEDIKAYVELHIE
ncbi:MAG: M20/M25/M40 family metallo-hydrolase, partial [Gammaproteobacteria bacterium]